MPAGYALVGGTNADLVITEIGNLVGLASPRKADGSIQVFTLWDDRYGGTQYLDTLDFDTEEQTFGEVLQKRRGKFGPAYVADPTGELLGVWVDDGDGEREWCAIQGKRGANGPSAYQVAVEQGFSGTVAEWLATLKSDEPGPPGQNALGTEPQQETLADWVDGAANPFQASLNATIATGADERIATTGPALFVGRGELADLADPEGVALYLTQEAAEAAVANELPNSPAFVSLQDSVFGDDDLVPVAGVQVTDHDANYKFIRLADTTAVFKAGVEYVLELIPSVSFDLAGTLQMGTNPTAATMVDTLAETGTPLTAGVPFTVNYTPSVDGLRYLRLLSNTANVPTVNVYTRAKVGGLVRDVDAISGSLLTADADKHHLAHRLIARTTELRALKNDVDTSLASLTQVQITEGVSKAITVMNPAPSRLLRVGLHYGPSAYTPSDTELFFDGDCRKDFTDVRFFDAAGNMLKAQPGELVNLELLEDDNLNQVVKYLSDGTLVGYNNGVTLSADNAATWTLISGTTNVTANASAQYARTSMYPVFVDAADNIFAYAGGILYKLLAADAYATKTPVLDFSWSADGGATTIYPDIQNHAMDAATSGILFMSPYQEQRRTVVYRSTTAAGDAFEVCWTGDDVDHQHAHHIHADPLTGKVYVGIDDGGTTFNGAHIIVTDDDGDTWTDITEGNHDVRGRDYYPTYFGDGYRLGGGESYWLGGATVIRSEDDENYTVPVKGIGGVRSYADFGDDSLIVAGVQHVLGSTENQIIVTEDQGRSFKTIYRKFQPPETTSGKGFRDAHGALLIAGDTEPCIFMPKDFGSVRSMRIYRGGDHWYREAFILLDEAPTGPVTITATTGYMMGYPYRVLGGDEHPGLVYHVPLNEGVGRLVADSRGNVVRIDGADYEWDTAEEPVRRGDYGGDNLPKPFTPSAGLLLKQGTTLNFGKIPALDFSTGFTVTFWINPDAFLMNQAEYTAQPVTKGILSVGDITLFHRYIRFGYAQRANANARRMMRAGPNGYGWCDQYFFVAITVNADRSVKVHINGTSYGYAEETAGMASFTPAALSTGDFVLGSFALPSAGYLSDVKVYNRVIGDAEILEMYRGV